MSTFDGIVREFPFIQIDYFRKDPERPPPLACFLSHVHSDHLQGLESFRAPFIYCSAATRELLLRIEKYPHRMNFNNGILESRRLSYKHLMKLLRPIPLNTPTEIDLTPTLSIRTTLLDANHCTGAVMFLIEGDGKAVLYTGDIRAETWWVNSLIRHPILIPYTFGSKRLDKIYLDTTFAYTSNICQVFPSKAEGIAELLQKVEAYPEDTTFYFRAWTFGYEEVWMALSATLKSKIHVDRYQLGLYKPLSTSSREGSGASEVPYLCGFELGNRVVPGVLSGDECSRVHSCEPGIQCSALRSAKTVYIIPIVGRTKDGLSVPEVGAGGGRGDLYQIHEIELPDQAALNQLEQLCREHIHDSVALSKARHAILEAFRSKSRALSLDTSEMDGTRDMPLEKLVNILGRGRPSDELQWEDGLEQPKESRDKSQNPLPKTIHFPYSRHSSYVELCELVTAFKPKDIHPCTVNLLNWNEDVSIRRLFGHLCSGNYFSHDEYMRRITAISDGPRSRKRPRYDAKFSTQSTQESSRVSDSDGDQVSSGNFVRYDLEHQNSIAKKDDHIFSHSPGGLSTATGPHSSRSAPPKPTIQDDYRMDISSSLPTSEITRLHSSLETAERPIYTTDDPLQIPQLTPEAAKVRRNTIRKAWDILKDVQSKQGGFHLGPLPSSWPIDDKCPSSSSLKAAQQSTPQPNQENISQQHAAKTNESSPQNPRVCTASDCTPENDVPSAGSSTVENFPEANLGSNSDEPPIDGSSQASSTLSIPSSAFASQEQGSAPSELENGLGYYDGMFQDRAENLKGGESSVRPSLPTRRAAYLAARADNYDAWAAVSLTSAGNNHTEEEIEL